MMCVRKEGRGGEERGKKGEEEGKGGKRREREYE
jgi:hypothetical protein